MNNLLHAGFFRLKKNKTLYGCLLFILAYNLFVFISQYINMKKTDCDYYLDPLFFNFLMITGILTSITVSLFIGTEYQDGTIRNKLISGLSRSKIYLSNFTLSLLAALSFVAFGYLTSIALGIPLFGSFRMPTDMLIPRILLGILHVVTYVAIFNLITMLCSNKTYAAVICILLTFFIIFASSFVLNSLSQPESIEQLRMQGGEMITEYVKNPNYLTGIKREIYQNILDFLPAGQIMQIFNSSKLHLIRILFYTVITISGSNIIGMAFFAKKDIK